MKPAGNINLAKARMVYYANRAKDSLTAIHVSEAATDEVRALVEDIHERIDMLTAEIRRINNVACD